MSRTQVKGQVYQVKITCVFFSQPFSNVCQVQTWSGSRTKVILVKFKGHVGQGWRSCGSRSFLWRRVSYSRIMHWYAMYVKLHFYSPEEVLEFSDIIRYILLLYVGINIYLMWEVKYLHIIIQILASLHFCPQLIEQDHSDGLQGTVFDVFLHDRIWWSQGMDDTGLLLKVHNNQTFWKSWTLDLCFRLECTHPS